MTQPARNLEAIAQTLIRAVETPATRRASPRVTLTAEVDLSSETNFFSGFSTDIAAGGLFIATLNTVDLGTVVAVKFTLPDGTEIITSGEVRWTRAFDDCRTEMLPGLGIQFIDLSPKSKAAIEKFIAQREPMFFPD